MAERAKSKGREKKAAKEVEAQPHVVPRLRERFRREITPALMKQFGYKNVWQVPRPLKVVINMGLGEAVANVKVIDAAVEELSAVTGQRPVVTRAKRSEAGFQPSPSMAEATTISASGSSLSSRRSSMTRWTRSEGWTLPLRPRPGRMRKPGRSY